MKLKGIILAALLLSTITLIVTPIQADSVSLFLDPPEVITDPPNTFTLNLTVAGVTDLRAWDVVIRWNPNIINLQSITEGDFLKSTGKETDFKYTIFLGYELSAGCTIKQNRTGVSGTGVLATLVFQCIDTGDPFDITFMSSLLMDKFNNHIPHTATGTKVKTQSPVVVFSRKVLTDVSGQRANDVDPAPNDIVRFDARDSYAQAKLVGDINRDGRVDMADKNLIGSAWFQSPGMPYWIWDADIALPRNNRIDMGDKNLVGANWFIHATQPPGYFGKIVNFKWEVDGVVIAQGVDKSVIEYNFTNYSDYDGYAVKLTVTDGKGKSWSKTQQVRIWRDVAAIDVWPCYDDYLGTLSVMPNDVLNTGTILFITGAYRNMGTLKQTYKAEIYLKNVTSGEIVKVLFTRTRSNIAPETRSSLWFPPTFTAMGMEVNDPELGQLLSSGGLMMFVDYDGDGYYTWGGSERPIWDSDASGNVTVGDIAIVEGFVIGADDPDIGMPLTSDPGLSWVDSDGNGAADIGERVYYDMDEDGTVSEGDFYVWLEEYYYGVIYDVQIFNIPAGTYIMGIKVTAINAPVDLDPTNDVYEFSAQFTVVYP